MNALIPLFNQPTIFLMNQINKLYCAQSHFYERLSEVMDQPNFSDLKSTLLETVNEMAGQIKNTNKVYSGYNCEHSFDQCDNVLQLLEEDFNLIQENSADAGLRNLTMLSYVQDVQNMITSASQLLQIHLKDLDKRIGKILIQNFNDMKTGQSLKTLLINRIQEV
jgi:ferritin-like metal-binding protein YciE